MIETPDVKRELRQIRTITKLIASNKRQIEELEYLKTSASSPAITGMPKGKGYTKFDKLESILDRISDLQDIIDEDAKRLIELKLVWIDRINELNHNECLLLKLRYFEGWSWSDISDEMNYEDRQVYRIRNRALRNLERIVQNNQTCQ